MGQTMNFKDFLKRLRTYAEWYMPSAKVMGFKNNTILEEMRQAVVNYPEVAVKLQAALAADAGEDQLARLYAWDDALNQTASRVMAREMGLNVDLTAPMKPRNGIPPYSRQRAKGAKKSA